MDEIQIDFEKLKEETGYDFEKNGRFAKTDVIDFLKCWVWHLFKTIEKPNIRQLRLMDSINKFLECIGANNEK